VRLGVHKKQKRVMLLRAGRTGVALQYKSEREFRTVFAAHLKQMVGPWGLDNTALLQIASVHAALQPHWEFQSLRFLTVRYLPRLVACTN
jgi:hypothetical protein